MRAIALVLVGAALLAGTYVVVRGNASDGGAASRASASGSSTQPRLPSTAELPRLDCDQPQQVIARLDEEPVHAETLCSMLHETGGANPRVILDRLVDDLVVDRAATAAGATVTDAELVATATALGADSNTSIVRAQLRTRLELEKLAARRGSVAVTEADVDAELAAGAPGIDRGQGTTIEGWLLRVPPSADTNARAKAEAAATAFAAAVGRDPDGAVKAFGFSVVKPFVLGTHGIEPDLDTAVRRLKRGELSGAIKTRVGWMVVRVLGVETGATLDNTELRTRVRKALELRHSQVATKEVLDSLRKAARIEILVQL